MSVDSETESNSRPLISPAEAEQVTAVLTLLIDFVGKESMAAVALSQARNEIVSLAESRIADQPHGDWRAA